MMRVFPLCVAPKVGAVGLLMVNRKLVETGVVPSVTVIVTVAVPDWLATRFTVATALELVTEPIVTPLTRPEFELEPLNTRFAEGVSLSVTPNVTVTGTFASAVRSPIGNRKGASSTGLTVRKKLVELVQEPSMAVSVMVLLPFASGTNVTVAVRVLPVPEATTPDTRFELSLL